MTQPDSKFSISNFNMYSVQLTRRQALKALITGQAFKLPKTQVHPLLQFGAGVHDVTVECWGGGGGGASNV